MLINVPHNTVMQGHVLDKLKELPNDCVDVVVTSTPYYGLRDYGPDCISIWGGSATCEHDFQLKEINEECHLNKDFNERWGNAVGAKKQEKATVVHSTQGYCVKCGAWKGQLGLEPHPSMFIEHLAQVFNEVRRVLKPSGSLWLNLGDTYFGGGRGQDLEKSSPKQFTNRGSNTIVNLPAHKRDGSNWLRPKQKMLIPARVAIALQDQGWILRNEIVWNKINHMPESCRDRLTRSWESLYFFVKSDRYYFDLDAIRKPLTETTLQRVQSPYKNKQKFIADNLSNSRAQKWADKIGKHIEQDNNLNPKKVSLFRQKMREEGKPECSPYGANPGDVWNLTNEGLKDEHFAAFPQKLVRRILQCSAPKYGLVLDPFAGAGTSLLVAHKMGFDWLGIELVPKYCKIIEKRIERHGKIRLDGFLTASFDDKTTREVKT